MIPAFYFFLLHKGSALRLFDMDNVGLEYFGLVIYLTGWWNYIFMSWRADEQQNDTKEKYNIWQHITLMLVEKTIIAIDSFYLNITY